MINKIIFPIAVIRTEKIRVESEIEEMEGLDEDGNYCPLRWDIIEPPLWWDQDEGYPTQPWSTWRKANFGYACCILATPRGALCKELRVRTHRLR